MPKTKIILDTDPGQDDAVAILLALGAQKHIHLEALSVVAGNVPLNLTSRNARIICDWAQREDLPVYAGCDSPLINKLITAEEVHGKSGLDGVKLHEPRTPLQQKHAVDAIIECIQKNPKDSISLCAVGPLTNIAILLKKAPEISRKLKQIVIMGGCYFEPGNVTPIADFNFFVDPHAASIVFKSEIPLVVLPLDVTHKACTNHKFLDDLRKLPNQCGKLVADILSSYARFDTQKFSLDGGPLHDPCAIGYLIDQSLFNGRHVHVDIETSGQLSMGASIVDWNAISGQEPNAYWITEVNLERFLNLITESIKNLP